MTTGHRELRPIDVGQWLSDASVICAHDFEPYAEHVLDLITLDLLEIVPLMDALLGERPGTVDDDVVVAISNTRFGYALRNREIQLLSQSDYVAPEDALATLLEERWGGTFGFLGGLDRLYAVTPGTTPPRGDPAMGEPALSRHRRPNGTRHHDHTARVRVRPAPPPRDPS